MANKDEYYQRIIASLQADISSQNKAISDLQSTVARQQKEIEALKASQYSLQKPSIPQQIRIDVETLLREVKRVCDEAILANYNHLPTIFADKQEFDTFRKLVAQKFLSVDTFNTYKKSQETRLKSIEDKPNHRFSLLTINRHTQKGNNDSKNYIHLDSIIGIVKCINLRWLLSVLVFLSLCMIAVSLYNSITD